MASTLKRSLALTAIVCGLFAAGPVLGDPKIFEPASDPFDKSFSAWTAEWWQFTLSIPTPANPMLDPTGADCMVGQHGPVWFLTGIFGGGQATRWCSVPDGTALFIPVVNSVNINTPNVCGQDSSNISVHDLRAFVAAFIDEVNVKDLSVELDDRKIHIKKSFRTKSTVFAVALPKDNVFDEPCRTLGGVPAGVYSPAVDDGYYVMLKPLSVGSHTLRILFPGSEHVGTQDVTYYLTVVPVRTH